MKWRKFIRNSKNIDALLYRTDHGGKLMFESNENEYTKVLILFPALTADA